MTVFITTVPHFMTEIIISTSQKINRPKPFITTAGRIMTAAIITGSNYARYY